MPNDDNYFLKNRGKKKDLETSRLSGQVDRQNYFLSSAGNHPGQGGPSILSRIFDVISRPNFAVAEGVRRGRSGGSPLLGFLGGLAGKEKTTFSKVLDEAGVENKFAKGVGGFALDVLLDPTTPLTLGVTKAAGQGAVHAASGRAFATALKSNDAKKAGRAAVLEHIANKSDAYPYKKLATELADDPQKNVKILEKALKTEVKLPTARTVSENAKKQYALDQAKTAQDIAATKGALQLKFMGRTVGSNEKIYKGVAKIGEVIGKTETGEMVSKMFRTSKWFPENTNALRRAFESQGVSEWESFAQNTLRPMFKGLTRAERRDITHAIEAGEDLTGVLTQSGRDLGKVQKFAKDYLRDLYDSEAIELGLHKAPLEDYVYHVYRNYNNKNAPKFKSARRAVGTEKPGFEKQRQIPNLLEAKEAGLKPVEEIDDILSLRTAKHHQVVARKQFVKAVEDEYGVAFKKSADAKKVGLVKPGGDQRFLSKDVYLPPEIAKTLENIEMFHTSDELANQLMRTLDKGLAWWKFGATAANPGHHVRNLVGDLFLNFEDGVVNPGRYRDAWVALQRQGSFKVGKKTFTGEQIYREFVQTGGKSGFFRSEFGKPGAGGVEFIRNLSEKREDFARMAHFIDALKKEGKNVNDLVSLRKAAQKATGRVRKYNIDYGDLTEFERRKLKRVIPFYTWLRKNIPLQIEMLALKPGRLATVPKGFRALETLLGTEPESGIGEVVPKWIRELAGIRLRGEGEGRNAIYWVPPLPVQDVSRFLEGGQEGFFRESLASMSPYLRIPVEQATGETLFSGASIRNNYQYASEQLPGTRVLGQLGRGDLTGPKGLNYLLGLGIHEITPESQRGELRRQQDPLQARIAEARRKARERLGLTG